MMVYAGQWSALLLDPCRSYLIGVLAEASRCPAALQIDTNRGFTARQDSLQARGWCR